MHVSWIGLWQRQRRLHASPESGAASGSRAPGVYPTPAASVATTPDPPPAISPDDRDGQSPAMASQMMSESKLKCPTFCTMTTSSSTTA